MMAKKESESFFVGINEPVETRRSLLESSKRVVQLLKRYETFRYLRKSKIDYINSLKKKISEIRRLNSKLKSLMPKTKIRIPAEDMPKTTQVKDDAPKEQHHHLSEVEKLDRELSAIEEKLTELS